MATTFNLVVLVGHMTADPELRYTPKGAALCKFTLGLNRAWTGQDGVRNDEVSFIDCTTWGKLGETISKGFKKGQPILVQGRLKQDLWTDKATGQKRSKVGVVVEEFQFILTKRATENEDELMPQGQKQFQLEPEPTDDSDVPF